MVSCIEDVQLSCDLEMAAYTFPGKEETKNLSPKHEKTLFRKSYMGIGSLQAVVVEMT